MRYELLRVTKTGSESLLRAFRDSPDIKVHETTKGHDVALHHVPDERIAIVSLRDPVRRFRSGYDMNFRDNHRNIRERYPTASHFAEALPDIMHDAEWGYTYRPQILWTGGAERMKERNVIWCLTEDIDDLIRTFAGNADGIHQHGVHWNSQDHFGLPRSTLTPLAINAIMQAYRADFRMLRQLGVRDDYFEYSKGRA